MFNVLDYKYHSWSDVDYSVYPVITVLEDEPTHVFDVNGVTYSTSIISYKHNIIFVEAFAFYEEPEEQSDSSDFICPYCGYNVSDSWEYTHEQELEITCDRCGKDYIAFANVTVTYNTYPKP